MTDQFITALFHPAPAFTTNFAGECWRRAHPLPLTQNWRGDFAPAELRTTARVLWSEQELFFGFECSYTELDVDAEFDVTQERHALWDRDVCEAFVRSPIEPHEKHYREFEVAPTGQWCDLIVDRSIMLADWEWKSGMRTASEIVPAENIWAENIYRVVMAIPFTAFGCQPSSGDVWKANLFRISRYQGERQYLAFSPTFTEKPNYHVSEAFVDLCFVKSA